MKVNYWALVMFVTTPLIQGCSTLYPPTKDLPDSASLAQTEILDLEDLRTNTASYEWFEFKPGVKKLILSGTPDTKHVSILWYWYEDKPGKVPLHYHDKTESIFVIEGTQTDDKGIYPKGSFYFNPPTSGHDIRDSTGLFLLSYAAPPDFKRTAEIAPYENLIVSPDYASLPLASCAGESQCLPLDLDPAGGMSGRFIKLGAESISVSANAIIVLEGSCTIASKQFPVDTLLVAKSQTPLDYEIGPVTGSECLVFELAFD